MSCSLLKRIITSIKEIFTTKLTLKLFMRFHPRRFRWWRYTSMRSLPSAYTEGNNNSMSSDDQIRWLHSRCNRCNSIFTITVLKDDIPVQRKCMSCDELYIYREQDLKDTGVL